jgi:SRSO17 transposase
MTKAGVPQDRQRFRTRQEICLELLDRHGDQLPHAWITGDDELGRPAGFRRELRERNEQYVLAVPCNTTIRDLEIPAPEYSGTGRPAKRPSRRVDRWSREQADDAWVPLDVRDGEKGPLAVEALKRRVETGKRGRPSVTEEVLMIVRYRDRDSAVVKTDYYLSNASPETPLLELCRVAKAEHRVEQCFQRAKGETGLGDYEVRNWIGWHHHQTLSLIASWFLTVETRRAEKKDARDHVSTSPPRHCLDPSRRAGMRYTPCRQPSRRTANAPYPNGKALPLEETQAAATKELGSKKILGQSN